MYLAECPVWNTHSSTFILIFVKYEESRQKKNSTKYFDSKTFPLAVLSLFTHCLLPEYSERVVINVSRPSLIYMCMNFNGLKQGVEKVPCQLFFKFITCCVVLFLTGASYPMMVNIDVPWGPETWVWFLPLLGSSCMIWITNFNSQDLGFLYIN